MRIKRSQNTVLQFPGTAILEYASPVWDPYTVTKTDKLETVQSRAARFVK